MTGGDDILVFEEDNWYALVTTFLDAHKTEWSEHIEREYQFDTLEE